MTKKHYQKKLNDYKIKHGFDEAYPLLTFNEWKDLGYHVKLGEHAKHIVYDITKEKKKQKDGSTKLCWVSIPIFLFEPDQVEPQKRESDY